MTRDGTALRAFRDTWMLIHVSGSVDALGVARSFYKGERLGKTPACAICVGAGQGARAELHLPGGVSVWLCAAHRDPGFLARRAGRDLVVSLMHVWRASGCFTAQRSRALDLFQAGFRSPVPRDRPGSYTWPLLRVMLHEATEVTIRGFTDAAERREQSPASIPDDPPAPPRAD